MTICIYVEMRFKGISMTICIYVEMRFKGILLNLYKKTIT